MVRRSWALLVCLAVLVAVFLFASWLPRPDTLHHPWHPVQTCSNKESETYLEGLVKLPFSDRMCSHTSFLTVQGLLQWSGGGQSV